MCAATTAGRASAALAVAEDRDPDDLGAKFMQASLQPWWSPVGPNPCDQSGAPFAAPFHLVARPRGV